MLVAIDLSEKEIEKLREAIGGDEDYYDDAENVADAIHTLIDVCM